VTGEVPFGDDAMLCVRIEMDPADFEAMADQQRWGEDEEELWEGVLDHVLTDCTRPYPDTYTWFEANAAVSGTWVWDVGIRKKGFVGSVGDSSRERPSIKLDTDTFVEDQTLGSTEHVTLNNNASDASRLRTCLSYSVFADAGYPAPRCNLANVVLNGEGLGTYSHVEAIKADFLDRVVGDDSGSLYEGTVADFTPSHLAGTPGNLGRWEAKTDETDATGAPLWRVAEALQASDTELEQALGAVLNLDRFYTFWALETLIAHSDGYTAGTNNFYVYFDPNDQDRAVFFPWGTDDTLSIGGEGQVAGWLFPLFTSSEITRRLSRHPDLSLRYHDELVRVLDEVWDEAALHARIDRLDPQVKTAETSAWQSEDVETLRAWIDQRRAQVESDLAGGLPQGDAEATDCYSRLGAEDIVESSQVLAPIAHGCASGGAAAKGGGWLALALVVFRRRQRPA